MTMFFTRPFYCFILLLIPLCAFGQNNFTFYFQPQIAINYNVINNYSHNFAIQQRSYIYDDNQFDIQARQLDISHFSKLKVLDNKSLALGIQYRFRETFEPDENNELRITQQFNSATKPYNVRFGHRVRSEQRITTKLTIFRFRYRFAVDLPLSGEQLDIGEAYFVGSLESLLSLAQFNKPEYDQRFTAHLGWLLNKNYKLQTGLEFRFEDYTNATQNILFFLSSLVISL